VGVSLFLSYIPLSSSSAKNNNMRKEKKEEKSSFLAEKNFQSELLT
jgi:hypothetical protein